MRLKGSRRSNTFYNLFEIDKLSTINNNYKFFYFRTSPRGNSKFGIMDIPWQRLRNQQQGTDEEIQFDGLWLVRTPFESNLITTIEDELKNVYKDSCLALKNGRAGHTEWFDSVDIVEFEENLQKFCLWNSTEIIKFDQHVPYTATKRSVCPFDSPVVYDKRWFDKLWTKTVDNTTFEIQNS